MPPPERRAQTGEEREALRLVAAQINTLLQTADDFAVLIDPAMVDHQYGGEDFIILLPETPKDGALTKAERLRRYVASSPIESGQKQPLGKITVSIGVATYPDDAFDSITLLGAADRALALAREQGKNVVQLA